jgi:site-specific recombinase XerC
MHAQEERETPMPQDCSSAAGPGSHEDRGPEKPQFAALETQLQVRMVQFITWYCSGPRPALNRAVVLRFRLYLESLGLAAGTVNQRLAAMRGLAYEAADSGLLSPDLAAGIRRVKGVKALGARLGNWLSADQARLLLLKADGADLRSIRDLAMVAVLLGCGLRRSCPR